MSLWILHQTVTPVDTLFVISGCSSSGKSTLLEALKARGEKVVPEAGRRVVKEQLELGLDGLPWANKERFVNLCIAKAVADFEAHMASKHRVFFDRSLIEFANAEALELAMPETLVEALKTKRYAPVVFMSPPWEALFATDEERRHSFKDAVTEYEYLVPTYQQYGYALVFLPQVSVEERVSFVLSTLAARDASSA